MTFTQEQLQQIEATAKEVLWPIIWTPLRARKHFEEKITPEVVLALARMALAVMEAEPVGVTDKSEIECLKRDEMANVMPPDYKGCDSGDSVYLYDAPQPLTTSERAELENYRNARQVVPEALAGDIDADDHPLTWSYHNGWNACRTAMLQGAEPVTADCKLPDDFDFDRFNDITWLDTIASNPHMHSLTTSTIAMVALELNRKLDATGNSPVVPDGWVMVPVNLTEQMSQAAYEAAGCPSDWYGFDGLWNAAITAAPQHEEPNRIQGERVKIQEEMTMGARLTKHRFKVK
ncbi:hypothetical protein LZ654_18850 [Lelliottia amnigena]|uniref:hypothetical protein n=1 Tax=Lelliottia amnigena TaxID=61646 RepID=UPI001F3724A3|nr:hypothetical protein [Lelliottia amnigena]MCE9966881.1 hypothetical protein [Lelliottia amnigena]